jgi:dolichol-phosphate mannosyltransferase
MRRKISIVVPFFNEEDNVTRLLAEIRAVCDALGQSYEAIFVNDGSKDATGQRLDEAANGWPEAKPFHFLSNQGQGAALFFGMKKASGEILVTLDGDGQNDPADIPRLLAALADCDMVAGARAGRQDSWLRLAMSRLANSVRSRLLGDGLRDTGCALKAFRCEVVEAFIPIRTLYSFMGAMAVAAEFRLRQIEVVHRPRIRGQSKYGLSVFWWKPLIDMIGLFWFSRRRIQTASHQMKAGTAAPASHIPFFHQVSSVSPSYPHNREKDPLQHPERPF